ncbi:Xre family transcriptional regulator [Hoeflea marina]|uniref:Xre family transcriptional regulator n=1 Tax=Hoeflea marina TaxID=274592 RepID=A0A317PY61_9HYPH|nr:helix-turn-helix transcriptional regulator [Hoeflea marina]PWW04450.1 Xre family transcriptional regulator [Hoeflea marina]
MKYSPVPIDQSFAEWRKDPAFVAAYDGMEDEFALAEALIRARAEATMTQDQVALAMGTTQAAVARLESGRSMPSTRTLKRFAEATGTRLRISFERVGKTGS